MSIWNNRRITIALLAVIFAVMFVCNVFTLKVADDWAYMYSWDTGERIESVFEIFPSMRAHRDSMNGRFVSHFFAQLFLMLPGIVFDVVNAAVFVGLILLILAVVGDQTHSNLLIVVVFGLLWIFTPAFGQVYLWLDGACNYLWGCAAGLIYLYPFMRDLLHDRPIKRTWLKVVWVILAFFVGAYSENGSASFLLMSALLQLAAVLLQKKKLTVWGVSSVAVGMVGFLYMVTSPGTKYWKGEASNTIGQLRQNFMLCMNQYRQLEVLLIVLCVMLTLACISKKIHRERIALVVILVLGSLIANFALVVANYYPNRSMIFCAVPLVLACAVLFSVLLDGQYRAVACSAASVLALYTVFFLIIGVNDVYYYGCHMKDNEDAILAAKAQGITDVSLPIIEPDSKYCAITGLRYLSAETTDTWPNVSIAKYFGIDTVIGYHEVKTTVPTE